MMTPGGLAIFYGGLTRQKNAVNTLHDGFHNDRNNRHTMGIMGVQSCIRPRCRTGIWIYRHTWTGLVLRCSSRCSIRCVWGISGPTIPHMTYMAFQMMFAIITPALIVAALAERMKFSAICYFYCVVGNICLRLLCSLDMVNLAQIFWCESDMLAGLVLLPSLDFAGGTVIHITSGWSGLVIALMFGRRLGYGKIPMEPHNISLIVLGAALLWVDGLVSMLAPQTAAEQMRQARLLQLRLQQQWL